MAKNLSIHATTQERHDPRLLFGAAEVIKILGITRPTFKYWTGPLGFAKPVQKMARGHLYDKNGVLDLALARTFMGFGLKATVVSTIFRLMHAHVGSLLWSEYAKDNALGKQVAMIFVTFRRSGFLDVGEPPGSPEYNKKLNNALPLYAKRRGLDYLSTTKDNIKSFIIITIDVHLSKKKFILVPSTLVTSTEDESEFPIEANLFFNASDVVDHVEKKIARIEAQRAE